MPHFLPPFDPQDRDLSPFERYVKRVYHPGAALAIFGREDAERLWRRHFPGAVPVPRKGRPT